MGERNNDTIHFKYSVSRLWNRVLLSAFPTVFVGLIAAYLSEYRETLRRGVLGDIVVDDVTSFHQYRTMLASYEDPVWLMVAVYISIIIGIIGIGFILMYIDLMIRCKRVFLILSPMGLQHNMLAFFFRIPYTRKSFYSWGEILSADIRRGGFFNGTRIELQLTRKLKYKNITHYILVEHSEHDAEQILKSIKEHLTAE